MTTPLLLRVRVGAPIASVRHALTDAQAMRTWLAERADVALPDRYEFWGRYTPAGDIPRQRLLHVDDRTLRFAWRIEDVDTTVDIALDEESAGSTILTLGQTDLPTWDVAIAESTMLSVIHTFWALSIANLIDHVEGRELTPKVDFTSARMREVFVIGAAPKDVFASILDPDTFSRWFGARVEVEPYVGGRWSMGGFELDPSPARIIDLDPARRFSIRFDDGVVTTWELEDSDGQTRLTFSQSGFDEGRPPYGGWMGWLGGIAELRRYHELPDWRPAWLEVSLAGTPDGLITITDDTSYGKKE